MSDILFACDLDNTILYSKKHRRAGDICVEMIHEQEQGFMTPHTIRLLSGIEKLVDFVPVTTRSLEQYRRIVWPADCVPEYALVANGAILLKNGEIEESWHHASDAMTAPYRDALTALMPLFGDRSKFLRCRMVDAAYLFIYCAPGVSPAECARVYGADSRLNVVSSGQKVYFFPPENHKGAALERLRELLCPSAVIAAGDSVIDIPMLNGADLAIIPGGFPEGEIHVPYRIAQGSGRPFSEFVLETVQSSSRTGRAALPCGGLENKRTDRK